MIVSGTMFLNPEYTPESLKRQREAEQEEQNKRLSTKLLAIDLAFARDYCAFVGMDCSPTYVNILEIERCRKVDYNSIVDHAVDILAQPSMKNALFCVDKTGIGIAVVQMFNKKGVVPFGISITAGQKPNIVQDGANVPKVELVYTLVESFNRGFIGINEALPLASVFVKELTSFTMKRNSNGYVTYEAASGTNDDILMAASTGVWYYRHWAKRQGKREARQHDF